MANICADDKRFDASKSYWGIISILLGVASLTLAIVAIKQNKRIIVQVIPEEENLT